MFGVPLGWRTPYVEQAMNFNREPHQKWVVDMSPTYMMSTKGPLVKIHA